MEGRRDSGVAAAVQYVGNGWNYAAGFHSVTRLVHAGYFTNVVTDSAASAIHLEMGFSLLFNKLSGVRVALPTFPTEI